MYHSFVGVDVLLPFFFFPFVFWVGGTRVYHEFYLIHFFPRGSNRSWFQILKCLRRSFVFFSRNRLGNSIFSEETDRAQDLFMLFHRSKQSGVEPKPRSCLI